MTKNIENGTIVTDDGGKGYSYAGPFEVARGGYRIGYDLRSGGYATIQCDPDEVAPLTALPAVLDKKDARIIVANDKAGRPGTWVGPWRAQVPGDVVPHWHRTKGEAVERAARRLAIRDWHAAEVSA